jgi:hypothetical protein
MQTVIKFSMQTVIKCFWDLWDLYAVQFRDLLGCSMVFSIMAIYLYFDGPL